MLTSGSVAPKLLAERSRVFRAVKALMKCGTQDNLSPAKVREKTATLDILRTHERGSLINEYLKSMNIEFRSPEFRIQNWEKSEVRNPPSHQDHMFV